MAEAKRTAATATAHLNDHDDHGHSLAAWTLVAIMLVGSLISAFAMVFAQVWLFWVGVAVIVLGGVVGKVMQVMGFGARPYDQSATKKDRAQGVR